jgi:hypothetical protein
MSFNSLSDLRKNRGNFDTLLKQVEAISTGGQKSNEEDKFWKPTVDKAGNGQAIIRFLPAPKGEEFPWVRVWDHGFQGPTGKWYIENSLTTLNKPDPVGELNSELWNSGIEANKEIARKQKRRLSYFSNILVIKDPANPANEGQVFLYKYGKKIFDKIKDVMQPTFEDENPINPFDFDEGVNFKLRIRQVEGYRNYDKSEFDTTPTPVAESDEALNAIWEKQHSLNAFLDPSNFKSYDELKKKLDMVLANTGVRATTVESVQPTDAEDELFIETRMKAKTAPKVESKTDNTPPWSDDDDADNMSYFASLADDD